MNFTRHTYRVAIRRSIALEATLNSDYRGALRGPNAWLAQINHTRRLQQRKRRERK